jgi:hypothetical protein
MNNWSDDEDSSEVEELVQPSRDFPISDDNEEEEDEYAMYELRKLTMNKTSDDLFSNNVVKNKKENNIKKEKIITSIWNNEDKEIKKTVRKFNPRLPPPNKYNKNNKNNFNLNMKDFPSL